MEHSVDGRFPNRHGYAKNFVFVDAGLLGHLFGGFLNFVNTVQRGLERVSDAACLLSCQMLFLAFSHIYRVQTSTISLARSLLASGGNVKQSQGLPVSWSRLIQ